MHIWSNSVVIITIPEDTCPVGIEAAHVDESMFGTPKVNNQQIANAAELKEALVNDAAESVLLNVNGLGDIVITLPVNKNASLLILMEVSEQIKLFAF